MLDMVGPLYVVVDEVSQEMYTNKRPRAQALKFAILAQSARWPWTRTKTGLRINAELDTNTYKTGLKVSDEEFATINIKKSKFHGEWNYTISPK
jgi:Rhodopirellula transposase DDE domain